jgi:acetate kinase
MKILVLNCGSSSLKFQLYNMDQNQPIAKGLVERIGMDQGRLKVSVNDNEEVINQTFSDHNVAIKAVLDALVDPVKGAIASLDEIDGIGHRVVHGGENFSSSVIVDDNVMNAIRECVELAPLHNPPSILGIEACKGLMLTTSQVVVFDTAFHQTMPQESYLYGIPYEMYQKHSIRRYGFHGTSHKYVAQRAAAMLDKPIADLKLVSCHLGNGSSIAAIQGGKSIDTSMGFTPLAGVIMGTRTGDLDPAIVPFIMEKEQISVDEISDFLNKKCGVLGLSGLSSDFRDLELAAAEGNERAAIALEIFANGIKKYVGAYSAIMGGIDAVIFTAGVGENSSLIREKVISGLEYLGLDIDTELNNSRGKELDVSNGNTKAKVLIIPTNEELMIALDTKELIQGK